VASRGVKLDEDRPDFMVIDDVDDKLDTVETVNKKVTAITNDLLPAGSEDLAVLVVQNVVHANGVVAQVADGLADFLASRILSAHTRRSRTCLRAAVRSMGDRCG
jgi:hypothetical protein